MKSDVPPLNIAQLNQRLNEISGDLGIPVARIRRMLCTLVVSQMLPDAVVIKGGMGVKLRMGESGTRATADLDVSTEYRGEQFEEAFESALRAGWGIVPAAKGVLRRDPHAPDRVAFTAELKRRPVHDPGLGRPQYVMRPYRVSLFFLGKPWAGLDVEVSDSEIEPAAHAPARVDDELAELNDSFGFGVLRPVEMISLEYQIAQKLHAVTDPAYGRAHDLVDLQLLWSVGVQLSALRELCVRTFRFRREQEWPPLPLRAMDSWKLAYEQAREETSIGGESLVLPDVDAAREWLHRIIHSIDQAG